MRLSRGILVMAGVLATGACDVNKFAEVHALNEVHATGSPFTQKLTAEYRDYVNNEKGIKDHADSLHFARKGLAAARGDKVLPEPLSDWNVPAGTMDELAIGRSRLITVYDL